MTSTSDPIKPAIRYRERRCASPKEGMRQSWGEYQIVIGRKVVWRGDTMSQAVAARTALSQAKGGK